MPDEVRGERVLVVAPTGRDGLLAAQVLLQQGLSAEALPDVPSLCTRLPEDVGVVLLAEEALSIESLACLQKEVEHQPVWSDLPILVFSSVTWSAHADQRLERIRVA